MRYHAMLKQRELLSQYDQIFYMDIDMLVCNHVTEEEIFIEGLTAVIHPGYPDSFERRPESTAFVAGSPPYYQGCFIGGCVRNFLEMCEVIARNIDIDDGNGIVAVWHDESHLNRYLVDHPPQKKLSPAYCFPETYSNQIKIKHLDKGNDNRPSDNLKQASAGKRMTMDKIQSLWVGDALSTMERLCLNSFIKNGHEFHLYTYNEVKNVPDGVIIKNANEIIPEEQVFLIRGTYASFADFFRWKLILEKGGWWVDTDAVCIKPFNFQSEYVFIGHKGSIRPEDDGPANGLFKAPAGCPMLQWGWEQCQKMDPKTMSWGAGGPPLFGEAMRRFGLGDDMLLGRLFLPFDYREAPGIFTRPDAPQIPEDVYSVHFFNEIWHIAGADKNSNYPPTSLYEQLKARYL
jgi:hypothetical protein